MASDNKPEKRKERKFILTVKRLKEVLEYNPETGIFTNRIERGIAGKCKIGSIAGSPTKRGRLKIKIDYIEYFAHQLAHLYMTSHWCSHIDHRDLDQSNTRWNNLRPADHSNNGANKRKHRIHGVSASPLKWAYRNESGRWSSRVSRLGKRYFLGTFDTDIEAHRAASVKAAEIFGDFVRFE